MSKVIRPECSQDVEAIRHVNVEAFKHHPFSRQTEHLIVEALRAANALEISLVAELDGTVVGHVAFSRVRIGKASPGWYLLGPVAVLPKFQGRGFGRALIEVGLTELRSRNASGCVLVGNPAFYSRFGFEQASGFTCAGVPTEKVLRLRFSGPLPFGEVTHHSAFAVGLDPEERAFAVELYAEER